MHIKFTHMLLSNANVSCILGKGEDHEPRQTRNSAGLQNLKRRFSQERDVFCIGTDEVLSKVSIGKIPVNWIIIFIMRF